MPEPWVMGNASMSKHIQREITPWEPQKIPVDMSSTYTSHYKAWPSRVPTKAIRPKDERPPVTAGMDTRSTQQDSYQAWTGLHMPKSCRPETSYQPVAFMQPVSTTHREAYQKWAVNRIQPIRPQNNRDTAAYTETGRSTQQDSYQPIMGARPRDSAKPVETPVSQAPFEGTTTSRTAYQRWAIPPRFVRKKPEPTNSYGWGDSGFPSSTYRDTFREISIPPGGNAALGIQVVGGNFYTMMPKRTSAPANKKVMMTTTLDRQSSIDVVVILSETEQNRRGKVIGEFNLDGIAPAGKGVPQIEVTFNLDTGNVLRVTANDLQGGRSRALTVKDKVRLG